MGSEDESNNSHIGDDEQSAPTGSSDSDQEAMGSPVEAQACGRRGFVGISLAFLLSGAAGLIMEVVWTRRLELALGNSIQAAATIAAIYMLGLGLGAFFIGHSKKLASLRLNPFRSYAKLEAIVAIWALLSPFLISAAGAGANAIARLAGGDELTGTPTILRILAVALVLLPPTLCMGASLPLLAIGSAREAGDFARRFGILYGLNILGAMTGALIAGFHLMPALGTYWAIAVGAVLAGIAALIVLDQASSTKSNVSENPQPISDSKTNSKQPLRWPIIVAGLSGFLALALEVSWFRALVMVFGSTTYSISLMLGIFLGASGLGALAAAVVSRSCHRRWWPLATGLGLIVGSVLILSSTIWFGNSPRVFVETLTEGLNWDNLIARKRGLAIRLIGPPAFAIGLALPLLAALVRMSGDGIRSELAAGRVFLANATGAAVGVLFGGFFLLPSLGLRTSMVVLGVATGVLGLLVLMLRSNQRGITESDQHSRPSAAAYIAIVGFAVLALMTMIQRPWDPKVFALGAYFGPTSHSGGGTSRFGELLDTSTLRYYEEGPTSTVAVLEGHRGNFHFTANGKVEADSSRGAMINQRLVGHLPLLLASSDGPKRVLNIGLGAGVTAGALGTHPDVERLDVVEIEPATTKVCRKFSALNDQVLDHPGLNLIWNDARNFLEVCPPSTYDVICSDPFEPVVAGAIHLFTQEHYELVASRLRPGGVVCQWIPMYEMSQDDYGTLVRTFASVFPGALLFSTGADSILVGLTGGVAPGAAIQNISERFESPTVRASLEVVGFRSADAIRGLLISQVFENDEALNKLPIMVDRNPNVEYSAPRNALLPTFRKNREVQIELFEKSMGFLGTDGMAAQRRAVLAALKSGLALNDGDSVAALQLANQARSEVLDHPIVNDEIHKTFVALGAAAQAQGDVHGAVTLFARAVDCRPDEFRPNYSLAIATMQTGNLPAAISIIDRGIKDFPSSPYFPSLRAAISRQSGRIQEAMMFQEEALRRAPNLVKNWEQYAKTAESARDPRIEERFRKFAAEFGK